MVDTNVLHNNDNLIVKSNQLIEANYRLTVGEQKLIYKLSLSINKDDTDFKDYAFNVSEFLKLLDVNSSHKYDEVKKLTESLMKKVLKIYDKSTDRLLQVSWISSAEYKKGTVILCFDPKLKPYLLQLKENFTKFDIRNVIQMRSCYSPRIYELLKQYETIGSRVLIIKELRQKLGILENEYPKYANLKQKVILQAQKEINEKTDISFDFEEIKDSRKVASLKFIIHKKENKNSPSVPDKFLTPTDGQIDNIILAFKMLFNSDLHPAGLSKAISSKGIDKVNHYLKNFQKFIDTQSIEDPSAFFIKAVTNEYKIPEVTSSSEPSQDKKKKSNKANFEQRKYSNEYYDSLYNNFGTMTK